MRVKKKLNFIDNHNVTENQLVANTLHLNKKGELPCFVVNCERIYDLALKLLTVTFT